MTRQLFTIVVDWAGKGRDEDQENYGFFPTYQHAQTKCIQWTQQIHEAERKHGVPTRARLKITRLTGDEIQDYEFQQFVNIWVGAARPLDGEPR